MRDDRVSRELRAAGNEASVASWHCNTLVTLWHQQLHRGNVFLDVGGNIGHCTLTMLMQTNALVVVVEPSPANRYYLTSTLSNVVRKWPDMRERVILLPFAAGNMTLQTTLYAAYQNAGNSVVGTRSPLVKDHAGQQMDEQYEVETRTLDDMMKAAHKKTRLLKLDVQGYECRALQGMTALIKSVHTVKVEAADRWLQGCGCSSKELLTILSDLDFVVNTQAPPACIFQRYGCDVIVHRRESQTKCSWRKVADAFECVPSRY